MTRYPKTGKGTKWTAKELDAITSSWAGDLLNDSESMVGEVVLTQSSSVSIKFKFGYKLDNKKKWFYCGTYPHMTLADIRNQRIYAKQQLKNGSDPKVAKQLDKSIKRAVEKKAHEEFKSEQLTFNDLFKEWVTNGVNRLDENLDLKRSFKNHALGLLGSIPLRDLTDSDLVRVYKKIIKDGKDRTAIKLSNDIKQMLLWGEKRKPWRAHLTEMNPAHLVEIKKLVSVNYSEERERVLDKDELKELYKKFRKLEKTYGLAKNKYKVERPVKKITEISLWLDLSTLCRIGETLKSEWKNVDFKKRTWFIPKEITKGHRGEKKSLTIDLSNFTLSKLKELHAITGHTKWLFPNTQENNHIDLKTVTKQVADRQIKFKDRSKKLANRIGSNSLAIGDEDWRPHDMRRSGATMMQELGINPAVIDKCQNHAVSGIKVTKIYQRYSYKKEMKEAWELLGSELEKILV